MRIRKMCILILVGVFGLLSLSYAQEAVQKEPAQAVRKQLAEELLVLTETDKNLESTFEMVKQMQMDQLKNIPLPKELSEEDSQKIASMQEKIVDILVEEMGWDKIKEDIIDIYVDVFTKEELEGIIAFYKTPFGQKLIKKQPELLQKSMEIAQKQLTTIMPKVQKAIQDMQEILKESEGKAQ
jgi:hypothetical protein